MKSIINAANKGLFGPFFPFRFLVTLMEERNVVTGTFVSSFSFCLERYHFCFD